MVAPLVGGALALSMLYGTGRTIESYRYWSTYYRNTGYRPRYPFRAGVFNGLTNNVATLYGFNKVFK